MADEAARAADAGPRRSSERFERRLRTLRWLGRGLRGLTAGSAALIALLFVGLVTFVAERSLPAFRSFGPGFLTGTLWGTVHGVAEYGAAPAIAGTLVTSLLAVAIAAPLATGAALFLAELGPRALRGPLAAVLDLAAAIPSVVLGIWGALVVAPFMARTVEPTLADLTGGSAVFSGRPGGLDVLTASVVLAIMIVPTVAAIARTAMSSVPRERREAAMAIGATRTEAFRLAVLTPAAPGIVAGVLLGLSRAIGETIVVAMTIGDVYGLPSSLFSAGQTIPSEIIDSYPSATPTSIEFSAIFALAIVLLAVSAGVHVGARAILARLQGGRRTPRAARSARRGSIGRPSPIPRDGSRTLPTVTVRRARRLWTGRTLLVAAGLCTLLAIAPVMLVIATALQNGGPAVVRPSFYTSGPPPPCPGSSLSACPLGGIGPALQGTALLLGLASLVAVPLGVLAGVYLSEYGRGRFTSAIRFAIDLFVSVPSILIGLFVFAVLFAEVPDIAHSLLAGAAALALLMLPIVASATEVAVRQVPTALREAAASIGFPRHRVALRVVLRTAAPAAATGVLLAVARAGGETAALVFTAFGSPTFAQGLDRPVEALGPLIFQEGLTAYPNWVADAWGATLLLLLGMLCLGIAARWAGSRGARAAPGGSG